MIIFIIIQRNRDGFKGLSVYTNDDIANYFAVVFFTNFAYNKSREILGVTSGDRITFIVEGNTVRIVNSAVYAMQVLQKEMIGEAERTGLTSDDDVIALVNEI